MIIKKKFFDFQKIDRIKNYIKKFFNNFLKIYIKIKYIYIIYGD